ncbi:MAG: hypothetical protein JKY53_14840, partial [Flavobacteriales bacterium]|nr:hypothetical protein [Flavobacteriales bacterium]
MRYSSQQSSKNLHLIAQVSSVFFLIIIARLLYLQVYHHQQLEKMGQRNFTRIKQIEPLRGNILDCNGKLLATNRPINQIDWVGSGLSKLNPSQRLILQKIETILQKYNLLPIVPLSKINRAEKFSTTVRLNSDVSIEALSEISEQCADSENIVISKSFKRF